MEAKKSYGLGDLGKEGVPGSRRAAFGIVITLISIVLGPLGFITSFYGAVLLLAARVNGFKSIWIWIGVVVGVVLFFNSLAIGMAIIYAS